MALKKLDFIVIGAAKSATTSLYELIKSHPDLYIPSAKEAPFFSDERVYKKGFQKYLKNYFAGADDEKMWGTVTPQYMLGEEELSPKIIAKRINNDLPNVKLIALLRNPTERAFSHYKMQVQRGYETRKFDEVVEHDLKTPHKTRGIISSNKSYIFGSEYGRILSYYYSLFPSNNILVLTTDDLWNEPIDTIKKLCEFLGIDPNYNPENPSKKYRKGGIRPRFMFLTGGFWFKIPLVKKIWKNLVPHSTRKKTEYFINLWNIKADDIKIDKDSEIYKRLVQFYEYDTELLEELTNKKMPWRAIRKTGK